MVLVGMSHLIGYGELATRLPNAIAGALICLIIFWIIGYRYKSPIMGFAAVLILLSSTAIIRPHILRTGEYDGLLLLFIVVFCLTYFLLLEPDSEGPRKRNLWIAFTVSVIMAIWTKGVAPMMIMPALAVYAIFQKKLIYLLCFKEFYLSAVMILFFGLGYYILREHYNPGYLKAVWDNELGGRYLAPNDGHRGSIWSYFADIVDVEKRWLAFFIIGLFATIMNPSSEYRRLVVFSAIVSLVFLVVISLGATKLYWYDAPVFPFFAVISGFGVYIVIEYIFSLSIVDKQLYPRILATAAICLIAAPGYWEIIDNNQAKLTEGDEANMSYFLKTRDDDMHINLNGYKVLYNDPYMNQVFVCQLEKLDRKGQHLLRADRQKLVAGDKVITSKESDRDSIKNRFTYKPLDRLKNIESWELVETK
jgi:4-amino-4-deoxy-L-arabinose transferase-like glycosyltransferase